MARDCYLITGASSGLGARFAIRLAEAGQDLILVARRVARLEQLAARLRARHGVAVWVVPADLAEPDAVSRLTAHLADEGLLVTHLVNNAGYGLCGGFVDLDIAAQASMIDVNCRAVVQLSHAMLPAMIEAGRGGILHVASTAGFQPGPWMAVYYATKAFVLHFSEGLHEELRGSGVHVAALCPGPVRTEFLARAGLRDSRFTRRVAMGPNAVVAAGLKALAGNRAVKVPGIGNATLAILTRFVPRGLVRRLSGRLQKARQG
jgi:short-subunit dehydrogenase